MMYEELVRSLKTEFGTVPDEDICDCEMCMMRKYAKDGDYTECVQKLGKTALDAIEELTVINERQLLEIAVLSKPRWIPVTERLPEDGQKVLAIYTINEILPVIRYAVLSYSTDDGFHDYEEGYYEWTGITHWMPLPEPPKDGAE